MTSSKYKKKCLLSHWVPHNLKYCFQLFSEVIFHSASFIKNQIEAILQTSPGLNEFWKKKNHFVKNVSFSCKKSYTVLFSWSMLYLCWKHFISYIPYQNIPYQFKYHADFFFLNLLKTFIQVKTTFSSITLSGRHSERH